MAKEPKPCTICQKEPALGLGAVGKMKSTCLTCITSLIAEGTCPACRGVETYSPEHIGVCDGKLPKGTTGTRKGATGSTRPKGATGTKSATQIGVEGEANKRSEARRTKVLSVDAVQANIDQLEAELAEATTAHNKDDVLRLKKLLAKANENLSIAKAQPAQGRCEACNCFLSDKGKCVNEDCDLAKAT